MTKATTCAAPFARSSVRPQGVSRKRHSRKAASQACSVCDDAAAGAARAGGALLIDALYMCTPRALASASRALAARSDASHRLPDLVQQAVLPWAYWTASLNARPGLGAFAAARAWPPS